MPAKRPVQPLHCFTRYWPLVSRCLTSSSVRLLMSASQPTRYIQFGDSWMSRSASSTVLSLWGMNGPKEDAPENPYASTNMHARNNFCIFASVGMGICKVQHKVQHEAVRYSSTKISFYKSRVLTIPGLRATLRAGIGLKLTCSDILYIHVYGRLSTCRLV